jgi:hypothetical protein
MTIIKESNSGIEEAKTYLQTLETIKSQLKTLTN